MLRQSIYVINELVSWGAASFGTSSFFASWHSDLCLSFQCVTWHSFEQYQIFLHLEHLLNAYFAHLAHLNPSISPSIVECEYKSDNLFASSFISSLLLSHNHCFCCSAIYFQLRFLNNSLLYLHILDFIWGTTWTINGLVAGCEGTFIKDNSSRLLNITVRLGIWSSKISFMYFRSWVDEYLPWEANSSFPRLARTSFGNQDP